MPESPPPAPKPPPNLTRTDDVLGNALLDETQAEKRLDEIEMIGEEEAVGLHKLESSITPGMRYLHCSRTIHQLVTDRNRSVGLYLAVASLLWTASSALLNAKPSGRLLVPIETIQRWCLPATFGTLTVLAVFCGLLLVRTRVGLIYEVAKMNVLLGLPVGRVSRINPLGIFFIMHALVSIAGGCSAGLLTLHLLYHPGAESDGRAAIVSALIGLVVALALVFLYIGMVRYTTADQKLQGIR
ncbi:MAG: hypothetical protein K2R98_16020 [Gemmataceae bacterium]|nr:hypothetical protein [Gemmataceae bacterium]